MSSTGAGSSSGLAAHAGVDCCVDIYPFEGGTVTLTGGPVISLSTSKSITQDTGSFRIVLAPESPSGSALSWPQIITPMSLAVIGLRRGGVAKTVMVGVVRSVTETQVWQRGAAVTRAFVVEGDDLAYFFTKTDFYTLWYLAAVGAASIGVTAAGLLSGDPGTIGQTWFEKIMSGGVFAQTFVPYKGAQIAFPKLFGELFEKYDVTVPYGDYFLGANGPWFGKFRQIFPFPFYEFFVTTDQEAGSYGEVGGTAFQPSSFPASAAATPAVVARLNPVPQLVSSVKGNMPSFDSIDTSLWEKLPISDTQGVGFIEANIRFSENEVSNFYALNPTWMLGQNGDSNSNLNQFLFNYSVVVDRASVNRYGYRPMIASTLWFTDITGQIAQTASANLQQLMATLLGRLCGYYEATPLMAKASVRSWLRPEIQVGSRFRYQPFKDPATWDFYIDTVQHEFIFGGACSTRLELTRGLPSDVYANASLLYNIHIGNAQRFGGVYKTGLPPGSAAPLQAVPPTEFAQWMLTLDKAFITPQGGQ